MLNEGESGRPISRDPGSAPGTNWRPIRSGSDTKSEGVYERRRALIRFLSHALATLRTIGVPRTRNNRAVKTLVAACFRAQAGCMYDGDIQSVEAEPVDDEASASDEASGKR